MPEKDGGESIDEREGGGGVKNISESEEGYGGALMLMG